MIRTLTVVALLFVVVLAGTVHASEKRDLFPGTGNWHRYSFVAAPSLLTGQIAVTQKVTILWDSPGTGVILSIIDLSNTTAPIQALSAGSDRMVSLEIGLLAGTYEIWVVGVIEPERDLLQRRAAIAAAERAALQRQPPGGRSARGGTARAICGTARAGS